MAILRTALVGALAAGTMVPINLSAAEPEPEPDPNSLEKILVVAYKDPKGYLPASSSTATGLDLSLRETPQSVTVITRARMDDQATDDISSVLKQAAGVTVNAVGPKGSDFISFYSRGLQIENFQIDGTPRPPLNDFAEVTTDMALYERVEIVRGATGLMNGAGSPSAAINLVRKRPTTDGQVSFEGELGSYEHRRAVVDLSGALNDSGSLRGRTVLLYQDDDAFIDRMNSALKVIYGIAEADLTAKTLLTAGIEYQDFVNKGASRAGVPLFFTDGTLAHLPRDTNTGAEWSTLSHTATRFFASIRHSFDNGWSVKLEGEESHPDYDDIFSTLFGPFDANTGAGGYIATAHWLSDIQQQTFSITASGSFQWLGHEQQLAFGGSYSTAEARYVDFPNWYGPNWWDYWAPLPDAWDFLDDGVFTPPDLTPVGTDWGQHIKQSGVYAALRLKPTDRIAAVLGLRVSDWKLSAFNYWSGELSAYTETDESNVLTPYAGVLVDLTENLTAYASYTDIFEPQSAEDMEGHRLDPLVGSTYEIGLKSEFNEGRLYAAVSAFRTELDNLAVPIPDAPPNRNGNYPFTAEDGTVSQGYELEVVGELAAGWQIGGGYAYAKFEDATDLALETQVPKDTFKVFSIYQLRGALQGLRVGGNFRWQGKSYFNESGPNGEDFVQGSQFVIDLMADYKVTEQVSLSLHVNNVTDEDYYSGVGRGGLVGFYETPRNFLFGFRWDL